MQKGKVVIVNVKLEASSPNCLVLVGALRLRVRSTPQGNNVNGNISEGKKGIKVKAKMNEGMNAKNRSLILNASAAVLLLG